MKSRAEKVAAFRALHESGCFVIPNPWDAGSARILEGLGFKALATTSSGYAFAMGLTDGGGDVDRDAALAGAALIARATDIPVSADMEDGYAPDPGGIAETVRLAAEAGLAGLSIEDVRVGRDRTPYDFATACERVSAAVAAARQHDLVLTARADGLLGNAYDLEEAIRRLRRFAELGADVVYAPGIVDAASLTRLCGEVGAPVNHLALPGGTLDVAAIAATGVRRISVGGGLARAAGAALQDLGLRLRAGDLSCFDGLPTWTDLASGRA